jgi:hypothetical protein
MGTHQRTPPGQPKAPEPARAQGATRCTRLSGRDYDRGTFKLLLPRNAGARRRPVRACAAPQGGRDPSAATEGSRCRASGSAGACWTLVERADRLPSQSRRVAGTDSFVLHVSWPAISPRTAARSAWIAPLERCLPPLVCDRLVSRGDAEECVYDRARPVGVLRGCVEPVAVGRVVCVRVNDTDPGFD